MFVASASTSQVIKATCSYNDIKLQLLLLLLLLLFGIVLGGQ